MPLQPALIPAQSPLPSSRQRSVHSTNHRVISPCRRRTGRCGGARCRGKGSLPWQPPAPMRMGRACRLVGRQAGRETGGAAAGGSTQPTSCHMRHTHEAYACMLPRQHSMSSALYELERPTCCGLLRPAALCAWEVYSCHDIICFMWAVWAPGGLSSHCSVQTGVEPASQ